MKLHKPWTSSTNYHELVELVHGASASASLVSSRHESRSTHTRTLHIHVSRAWASRIFPIRKRQKEALVRNIVRHKEFTWRPLILLHAHELVHCSKVLREQSPFAGSFLHLCQGHMWSVTQNCEAQSTERSRAKQVAGDKSLKLCLLYIHL